MFAGFTNADSKVTENSSKVTKKIFDLGCFCENTLFPFDPTAKYRIDPSFFPASLLLMLLTFCFPFAIF